MSSGYRIGQWSGGSYFQGSHLDLQRGRAVVLVWKMWHPSPTSEDRQLASFQVPLWHRLPPTHPSHPASLQESYKKAYILKILTGMLAWDLKAQRVGEQRRLPEAGGLGSMSKTLTPT